MSEDLKIIKELEKKIGVELKKVEKQEELGVGTYQTDADQQVIVLVLGPLKLKKIPQSILQLKNLTELFLVDNQLNKLPPGISQLTKLTYLNLARNRFKTLPHQIFELKNLQNLWLYENQITFLPEEIIQLKKLSKLGLGKNPLANLPQVCLVLKQTENIKDLTLNYLGLTDIPKELFQLENLTFLDLSDNKLTTLPGEIAKLKNLENLILSFNEIGVLPEELTQLENLETLHLYKNKINALPPGIGKLKDLRHLVLLQNNLTALPASIGQLKNLRDLDLKWNQLTHLPHEIIHLKNLKKLEVNGNPLKQPPPEIANKGIEAIFEYLRQLPEEKVVQKVNEAKLILVGQGDVGKTCLAKRLKYNTFQHEKSTEGIDILQWEIKAPVKEKGNIKLNTWDFGGQEVYHATHQFFLTRRSLYILVWNARKSQDYEHIYYWLHTIEAFGEDSPIILVLSKCLERDDDLNLKDLKQKFPQIKGLYKIDSSDGTGIPYLKDVISQVSWTLPHMQTPWVDSWFKVREQLENDDRDWIEYKEFREICLSKGLDQKQTDILDGYLHDLGVIIHFRDKLELKNMIILKPEWATHAVYKIIDTQSVRDRGGVLLHNELENIWDSGIYPPGIFPQLLKLMEKFELAYELPDKKSHLVVELLFKNEPEFEWENSENLRFYYFYDFLPAGVITRFIVRVHQDLETVADGKHLCWREGAILQRENTRALVKVKPIEKRIEIKVKGSSQRKLLDIIFYHLDHINSSIKKIKITKHIPCNCSDNCPFLWDYDKLLKGESQNIKEVQCMETWKTTTISSLLDGYEKKEDRMKRLDQYRYPELHLPGDREQLEIVKVGENKFEIQPKKEKKKWYKTFWGIIGGIAVIVGLIVGIIQLVLWLL